MRRERRMHACTRISEKAKGDKERSSYIYNCTSPVAHEVLCLRFLRAKQQRVIVKWDSGNLGLDVPPEITSGMAVNGSGFRAKNR